MPADHSSCGLTRRNLLTAVAVTSVTVLAACGPATNPPAPMTADALPAGQGYVALRITVQGLKYLNSLQFTARPVGGGPDIALAVWSTGSDGYWSQYYNDGEKGSLIWLALPLGDYELVSFGGMAGAWGGLRGIGNAKPLGQRFKLTAGALTYAGHLALRFRDDHGVLPGPGGKMLLEGDMKILNAQQRDLDELQRLAPSVASAPLRVHLLR